MGDRTGIGWTDATWNPVTGCTKVSDGCDHCYAEGIATRFAGTPAYPDGFAVTLRPERLDQPLRWRKPRRVFVNSMSDLFHKDIPDEYIARVFAVMALAPQHQFQILTKRHGRMRSLLSSGFEDAVNRAAAEFLPQASAAVRETVTRREAKWMPLFEWPLPNVWLGVSVEDQKTADLRIPALLDTPAVVRFLSCEPLLGPVDLFARSSIDREPGLDWVIVGGESGNGARPMSPTWARTLRDQCAAAQIPFYFKQWGAYAPTSPAYALDDDVVVALTGETTRWADERPAAEARTSWVMRRGSAKTNGNTLDGAVIEQFPTTPQEAPA